MQVTHPRRSCFTNLQGRVSAKFVALATADAACISLLYWNPLLLPGIRAEFDDIRLISVFLTMPLVGYAIGILMIAKNPRIGGRWGIECQLIVLSSALLMAGLAPDLKVLVVANLFIGIGSAVAQRLLVSAVRTCRQERAGAAIGIVISGGLTAILGVRVSGTSLSMASGWRGVFVMNSLLILAVSVLVAGTQATRDDFDGKPTMVHSICATWRSFPLVRRAALQQAALFAAFHASWTIAMLELQSRERFLIVICGGSAGIIAAAVGGHISDVRAKHKVVAVGATCVFLATCILMPIAYSREAHPLRGTLLCAAMALVDAGVQLALIANQGRVQALSSSARAQLAAIVTAFGFVGGAAGSGIACWLLGVHGWSAAVAFSAALACVGCGFASGLHVTRAATTTGDGPLSGFLTSRSQWRCSKGRSIVWRRRGLRPAEYCATSRFEGFVVARRSLFFYARVGKRRHGIPRRTRGTFVDIRSENMHKGDVRDETPTQSAVRPIDSGEVNKGDYPAAPTDDGGLVRIGGHAPLFVGAEGEQGGAAHVKLGGHAPLFYGT